MLSKPLDGVESGQDGIDFGFAADLWDEIPVRGYFDFHIGTVFCVR